MGFADPFGLASCPRDVGGDDATETVDDCPSEVVEDWKATHIKDTSKDGTDLAGVDPRLMAAVVLTSMEFRMSLGLSAGREPGHSIEGRHAEGGAVDINRANGIRFGAMTDEAAIAVGGAIASAIQRRLGTSAMMVYSPAGAFRTNRPTSAAQRNAIIAGHRSHVHVTIAP